ncbi:pyridoxal phosphate-dependent aminotransferase [Clostridium sediminicola]|uniref:pyridoxal phosphate-dependent aminotransferase n=1 Tax=Clostridium sediminicola TaxID=3114879 RepID=UPI0031F1CB9E
MKCSRRILGVEASPVRKLVPYANEAVKNGKKVYHLNIGQPDIKTPELFMDAVRKYDKDTIAYVPSNGLPELIDAVRGYYSNYGMEYAFDEVLITQGGSEALLFTLLALLDVGDQVLVVEPYYANYNTIFRALEIDVVAIKSKSEEGFHLPSKEVIDEVIKNNPKIKAALVTNPNNPTGTVYTKEEMKLITDVVKENDIFVISDEVYREFVYEGSECASLGTMEGLDQNLIIIDSISKRYSACGARIGCVLSKNKEVISQIYKMCQVRLAAPELEQIGAIALYQTPQTYFKEINAEYTRRRDVLFEELNKMEGVVCFLPEGAFYTMVKLPVDDAEKFVIWLLSEFEIDGETIMMAPGEGFYATEGAGVNEVRIAYVLNEKDLRKAMHILGEGLKQYPGKTN